MKRFTALALAALIALTLAACGASEKSADMMYSSSASTENGDYGYGDYDAAAPEASPEEAAPASPSAGSAGGEVQTQDTSRKLIKNVWLNVEALEFDKMVAEIQKNIVALGGYIESSNVSGNSVYSSGNRYASITARIPAEELEGFVAGVEGMGNVTSREDSVDDITLTYVDMTARVESLQTEYDRLLELLAEADNLDSIIALEQRLTEVRYEIESYKSQLRTYDNQVDYSTVYLNIDEVERITPAEEKGVWERISTDFGENLYSVGESLTDFFVWFVSSLPYLLVWAVVIGLIVLVVLLIVKGCRRSSARAAEKRAKKLQKQYEQRMAAEARAMPAEKSKEEAPAPQEPKNDK